MKRQMTYLELEASRNRRLWIKEVVIPGALVAAYICSKFDVKGAIDEHVARVLERVHSKRTK